MKKVKFENEIHHKVVNMSQYSKLSSFLIKNNLSPSPDDKDKIEQIYHVLFPEIAYNAIKYQSNYYSIGDTLLILGKAENLIGELTRIIPNNGIKSNPFWPSIEVQWYYKKSDLNKRKNNLIDINNYNSISDYELFPTNHRDIIYIETVIGKCEVFTYEEYENLEEHTEKTFYTRAKYDPLNQILIPRFDEWKKGCVCQCPLNPDQLYIKCDKCNGWYHPKCCGIEDEKAEEIKEFYCPYCREDKDE